MGLSLLWLLLLGFCWFDDLFNFINAMLDALIDGFGILSRFDYIWVLLAIGYTARNGRLLLVRRLRAFLLI